MEAFFLPGGDGYRATEATRGPWSPELMHGGPPAALLARAIEAALSPAGMQVVRLTVEFLRPLAIDRFSVAAAPIKPGRTSRLHGASLFRGEDEIVRATGLGIRQTELDLPGSPTPPPALPPPESCAPFRFPFFTAPAGYHTAMEARLARGTFGQGAMALWMRMRVPLLPGEVPSPLVRVVTAADSGNGVSVALDVRRFTFVNPDLTVYLHRPLEGEWVGLDARTTPDPAGAGLADTLLHDAEGPIGRALQSLVVAPR